MGIAGDARLERDAHGRLPLEVRVHAHRVAVVLDLQPQLLARRRRPLQILAGLRVDRFGAVGDAAGQRGEVFPEETLNPMAENWLGTDDDCSG